MDLDKELFMMQKVFFTDLQSNEFEVRGHRVYVERDGRGIWLVRNAKTGDLETSAPWVGERGLIGSFDYVFKRLSYHSGGQLNVFLPNGYQPEVVKLPDYMQRNQSE
jgi:hypothetical protein